MAEPVLRVLVVDDEENVRYVIAAALRLAGFEVEETSDGRGILDNVARQAMPWDVVVLDVMLGEVSGFDLCRRVRAAGLDIPIVFLTARGGTEDIVRGLSIGGDDYLTKPFSVEELVARVRVALRRLGKAPAPTILAVGDIELDDEARIVRRAGEEVHLSPTEFKLLRYLLKHPGRALSRAQIIDHVWDYDFDGEFTVVETFVSSLRKKLDPAGDAIQTVRGFGYRLQAR